MIEHPMLCSIVAWISGTRKTIHTLGQFQSIFNRYAVNFFTSNVMMFHVNIDYQINTFIFYFLFFLSAKNGIKIKGDTKGYPNPFTQNTLKEGEIEPFATKRYKN